MKRISTSFILLLLSLSMVRSYGSDEAKLTFNQIEPVLTQKDFADAKVLQRKGKTILQATLTDAGAAKLKGFSSAHVGEKLIVMNGDRVIAAPVIRSTIQRQFEVDAISRADAEELVQLINQR